MPPPVSFLIFHPSFLRGGIPCLFTNQPVTLALHINSLRGGILCFFPSYPTALSLQLYKFPLERNPASFSSFLENFIILSIPQVFEQSLFLFFFLIPPRPLLLRQRRRQAGVAEDVGADAAARKDSRAQLGLKKPWEMKVSNTIFFFGFPPTWQLAHLSSPSSLNAATESSIPG